LTPLIKIVGSVMVRPISKPTWISSNYGKRDERRVCCW